MNFARLKWRPVLTVWMMVSLVTQATTLSVATPAAIADGLSDVKALPPPPLPVTGSGNSDPGTTNGDSESAPPASNNSNTSDRKISKPKEGLEFAISEGKAPADTPSVTNPVTQAEPLSEEETNKLLNMLPPLEETKLPVFTLPGRSLPPPNGQHRKEEPFPPAEQKAVPPKTKSLPLTVMSKRPTGAVERATNISITFSQPMVPISSQAAVSAIAPPVALTPQIPGEWKWYGTQTLTFEPKEKSLPMATTYQLKVPAGTKSAIGSQLASEVSWPFSTAKARMLSYYPDNHQPVRPTTLMMARFNQKVDKNALLGVTKITSAGRNFTAVAASETEIAADTTLSKRLRSIPTGMAVVFKSGEPLPSNATAVITIGPGIKSAEGPLVENKPATFSIRTFGPMNLVAATTKLFAPEEALYFEFTNPIDTKTARPSMIKVTPAIPDMAVQFWGQSLNVSGLKKPNAVYHVEFSNKLQDQFGQSLTGSLSRDCSTRHVEKQLYMSTNMIVIPSKQKPKFQLTTVNLSSLDIKFFTVNPNQYRSFSSNTTEFLKSLKPVHAERLKIKNTPDQPVITELELNRWLNDGRGNLVISVSTRGLENDYEKERTCWIQCTNLGLDVFADTNNALAWATDLETGAPIKDAKISLPNASVQSTDASGLVTIALTDAMNIGDARAVVATHGKDTAFVNTWGWYRAAPPESGLNWYVVTDRSPYKPGETVSAKGIIRNRRNSPVSDLTIPTQIHIVSYEVLDVQGNSIGTGKTDVNKFGGFDLSFKLPTNASLGNLSIYLHAQTDKSVELGSTHVPLTVAEFRRPEFELKLKNEGEAVHMIGGSTTVSASTNYYAGGNLAHTDIHWSASASETSYSPPGWDGFSFGRSDFPMFSFFNRRWAVPPPSHPLELKGKTDANGQHFLKVDFLGVHPPQPSSVEISATVQDVNRQTWTDTTNLIVHPSSLYVGTKQEKTFIKKDSVQTISLVVTDIDGKAKPDTPIKIHMWRSSQDFQSDDANSNNSNEKSKEKEDDVQNLAIASGIKPVELALRANLGGLYKVSATVIDDSGRPNETVTQFWVQGGEVQAEANPDANFHVQKLFLLAEKTAVKPGDEASILVQSPFAPAEGVATIWHNGIAKSMSFHMDEKSYRLQIPITEQHIPEVRIQIDVVGVDKKTKTLKAAPAEATESVDLKVSSDSKQLTVDAKPDVEQAAPGKEISINLTVLDNKGEPVPDAEVTVAVVDDALLSLTKYSFSDPLNTFYSASNSANQILRERELLDMTPYLLKGAEKEKPRLTTMAPTGAPTSDTQFQVIERTRMGGAMAMNAAMPPPMLPATPMPQMAMRAQEKEESFLGRSHNKAFEPMQAGPTVQVRSNFDALAKWVPSIVTDETGHAVIKFKLPDNLTRYRIMAVASHKNDQFGLGDSSLTARLPLMAKPSAPRFLNFGDKFELPIVIQNQTDSPMEVNVAARATNAVFTGGQGRHTKVPANDRVEIRMPVSTAHSGTAKFQVIVASGATTDSAQFNFPVYTPATTEAFATYGQIEKGSIQQLVQTPENIIPDFGALELTTSTTVLETLTDAYLYLQHYSFECSEQLASRLISVALLKDMLKAFKVANMPSETAVQESVSDDLKKLKSRQQSNGSFALWSSNERHTYPWVTLQVAHALLLIKKAGRDDAQGMLDRAMSYIKDIDRYIPDYTGDARIEVKALALYLRDQNGDTDIAGARALLKTKPIDKMPLESLAFLLDIFTHNSATSEQAAAIHTYLSNLVVETASTAQIVRPDGRNGDDFDFRLFDSPMRLNAILLDAMLADGKSPELVTKLMRTVLGGQVKGRWRNTQENVYVLLAMRHYFDKYEKVEPNLIAEAWLGKDFIGESSFKGRSNEFKSITVPMSYLAEHPKVQELILRKNGEGRLYYRLGMSYAPSSLHLQSMERGFAVTRSYEGATQKDDVTHTSDGTWHFKSGSLVKVKLKLSAPAERFFVALVDPIPAGAESLNNDLQGTEAVPNKSSGDETDSGTELERGFFGWWRMNWWNHQNKRDNQTEIFADQLQSGSHEFTYIMRATTPGTFVVPPTKAEEMYNPETFGRAQTESVVIE